MMASVGYVLVAFFCVISILSGLLNLGGCGDRIGPKYRRANLIQVFAPIAVLIAMIYFS